VKTHKYKKKQTGFIMTTWNYKAFESTRSGREGVTELEHRVTEKLEALGLRAEYAKVVMTNIVEGAARAVIYYPDAVIPAAPVSNITGWTKNDVNTIADSSDTRKIQGRNVSGNYGTAQRIVREKGREKQNFSYCV
jgi:predicted dinucleotide-utilizing enzyme